MEGEQRSTSSRRRVSKPARYKDDNECEWKQLPKGVVGGSKRKSPPSPSASDITHNNKTEAEGAVSTTTAVASSIPSSSPLPNKAEKIVGVVQSLMASNISLSELRNKGRDEIKAIVRQSNILFGNQFWQGIKSLLHAAIDSSEEIDGTEQRVFDRDTLLRLYASSCSSTNASLPELDAVKPRARKKKSSTANSTMGELPSPRSAEAAKALSSLFSTDGTSSSSSSSAIPTLQETTIEDVMAEAAAAGSSTNGGGNNNTKLAKLPKKSTLIMEKWIQDNTANPYPTKEEKDLLVQSTGLLKKQIESWMEKYRRHHGLSKKSRYPEEAKLHLEQWIVANLTDPYPTEEVKISLSEETGLTKQQVESWLEKNRSKRGLNKTRSIESYPEEARTILNQWLDGHMDNPFPSVLEMNLLARETGLTDAQVENWFDRTRAKKGLASRWMGSALSTTTSAPKAKKPKVTHDVAAVSNDNSGMYHAPQQHHHGGYHIPAQMLHVHSVGALMDVEPALLPPELPPPPMQNSGEVKQFCEI